MLVNLLEFELVVSVVAVAAVLDLVSTSCCLGASCFICGLGFWVKWLWSSDPCVIAVSMVAMRTVVTHVVFLRRRVCRWLLLCQVLLSGYTMFGALIGIVSSDSHQHLSHFSLCG